jgi:sugar phosphate isomerase/epimerase
MAFNFRYSVCNEVYENRVFPDSCKAIRKAGYTGIEIAPFTLSDDPASIPPAKRREYAETMASEGLKFAGLHWLLVAPKGLHVTTPDLALRARSWEYLHRLVDLCADLGPNGVMVFGSPKQRASTGGMTPQQATRVLVDGLAALAPHAAERGVTVLLEALPVLDSDVVTSLDEAAAIVRQVNHPGLRTMFDSHNGVNEREPHAVLVDRYFDLIRHVHVNEMDGRHPGTGNYDFKPVLQVLARRGYSGWVSLEVFDFTSGADKIAADSIRFLQSEVSKL